MRDTVTQNGVTTAILNDKIKSQRSLQFIGAFDYRFRMLNRPFKFSAEAYYKALSNLIPYNVQNMKVTYYGQNLCSGYAAGLDLKLYGEFVPGTDSWLTFSVMSTRQKMNGEWIPPAHRPEMGRKPALHGLFPWNRPLEDDLTPRFCRRTAIWCAPPRTRESAVPHTSLQTSRYRHELQGHQRG